MKPPASRSYAQPHHACAHCPPTNAVPSPSQTPVHHQHFHAHPPLSTSYYSTTVCAPPQAPHQPHHPHQPPSWPPTNLSPHTPPPPPSYPYLPPTAPLPHQYVLLPPIRPPYMLTPAYAQPPQQLSPAHSPLPSPQLPQLVTPSTPHPVASPSTPYYMPPPHSHPRQITPKKRRLQWTPQLHAKFVSAVQHFGIDQVVPKQLLRAMDVPGLTRENVASHLQKYRQSVRKSNQSSKPPPPSRTKHPPAISKSPEPPHTSPPSLANLPPIRKPAPARSANRTRAKRTPCDPVSPLRAPHSSPRASSSSSSSSSSMPHSERAVKKRTITDA